jgi:hypothetical protein
MRTIRILGLAFTLCLLGPVAADDPEEISDEQRAQHLEHMKKVASSIRLLANQRQADSVVKLVEDPILRYSDDTRLLFESSLWIWSDGGRPSAVLAVEYYPKHRKGPRWLYEIASLSTQRIAAQREPDLRWAAKGPGLRLRTLDDADPAADKPARRLAQMKELRNRFSASEKAPVGGRIELRPLNSPLHRYADSEEGVVDGAIFAFANGTNPEVLLVIEAHARKDAGSSWQYGLVQMTGATVAVELGGKEVWQCEEADPPAVRESYVNGWISSKAEEK